MYPIPNQIRLTRKYLKVKILEDNITFRGHNLERQHVYELFKKTVALGDSHSALILGPKGCGKTTMINSVLNQLSKELDLERDAIIIKLNGLLHHDEKLALKAITVQMQLENAVGDRVFGTFAENLAFLLSCLKSGVDRKCKSMIFILEEFDLFCHSGRTQTLLYNLFDITHSGQSPMCVVGITSTLDVMELLEKRVKSRFSHRHIFLYPNTETDSEMRNIPTSPTENLKQLFVQLLSLPTMTVKTSKKRTKRKSISKIEDMEVDSIDNFSVPKEVFQRCKIDEEQFSKLEPDFVADWNAHVMSLSENDLLVDALDKFCYYTVNEQIFRDILFQVVCKLSQTTPYIDVTDVCSAIDKAVASEHRVALLQSLSILELSLLIAMKHGLEIFNDQPMNFEMILHRYTKFANAKSSTQSVPRQVILKAFEHLQALELILPVKSTDSIHGGVDTANRVQKEYQFYTLAVPISDLDEAVKKFKALPTEIHHWYSNSVF